MSPVRSLPFEKCFAKNPGSLLWEVYNNEQIGIISKQMERGTNSFDNVVIINEKSKWPMIAPCGIPVNASSHSEK